MKAAGNTRPYGSRPPWRCRGGSSGRPVAAGADVCALVVLVTPSSSR